MAPLRVAAHVDLRYTTRRPTGVDKHVARMVWGLARTPGFEVTVVAPRAQSDRGSLPATSSLAGLPFTPLPLSNRAGRMVWGTCPGPGMDRYCPGIDWVWSPQELWAPGGRARSAVTIHGSTYFEPSYPGYHTARARLERARLGWFLGRVCRRADLVLPVSPYLERFLVSRYGLDPARSVVVGNGVDDVFFAAGEQAAPAHDPERLLVVGGLNAWDGGERVVACADELARRLPGMSIDVVGTMDEGGIARAAAARGTIRRLGYRPAAELAAMMPGYLALLYLPNVESFGMVALEAMAAGLPVIACRLTAVPETAGEAARYVDEDRPAAVVDAIEEVRGDAGLRAGWCAAGRERARGRDWASCVARLAAALRGGPAAATAVTS